SEHHIRASSAALAADGSGSSKDFADPWRAVSLVRHIHPSRKPLTRAFPHWSSAWPNADRQTWGQEALRRARPLAGLRTLSDLRNTATDPGQCLRRCSLPAAPGGEIVLQCEVD